MSYFEVKVKYEKTMPDGSRKKVNEPYLVDAVSFSDAETRINKVLEPYISGVFFVNSIKIANYSDIIKNENEDRWFKCKVSFINIDENGKERKTHSYALVQACNVVDAKVVADKSMDGCVSDYEIPAVAETKIQDVFEYEMSEDVAAEKYLKVEIGTGDMIKSTGVNISDELKNELNK